LPSAFVAPSSSSSCPFHWRSSWSLSPFVVPSSCPLSCHPILSSCHPVVDSSWSSCHPVVDSSWSSCHPIVASSWSSCCCLVPVVLLSHHPIVASSCVPLLLVGPCCLVVLPWPSSLASPHPIVMVPFPVPSAVVLSWWSCRRRPLLSSSYSPWFVVEHRQSTLRAGARSGGASAVMAAVMAWGL